ncbi:MAG: efflux RND transporter periplasmic adaptor subunit, partial [Gammaproteobacteria bacterium]|nr:efflux RND transporter periplasmic adaptor subunit [Gammaproteobacteria bacterium]
EEVLRSEKIFSLQDVSSLKMIIDVPENLMITIDKSSTGQRELYATFDNIKNKRFPLKFREASTKADPSTKTFEVTLTMDSSQDYNILPGMNGTVFAHMLPDETGSAPTVTLPVSAVISDNRKQATVWIVDEDTMTVHPKKVVPGLMTGDSIQVDGLSPGDRIVTAGASFLRENMKVTLLQTGEQPEQ